MNIMVIGSGGREHAIIQKIKENPLAERIYALPGNPGMAEAVCVPGDPMNTTHVVAMAKAKKVDFCIVTPDDPLAIGLVDALEMHDIPCFGPGKQAAKIESSKLLAKQLMEHYQIPTAKWKAFTKAEEAFAYLDTQPLPIVVKADGLAKGKGVVVAQTLEEARQAVRDMLENKVFGASGATVIIEECLTGQEVSVLCLVDGVKVVPLLSAMDHKRALDGDGGPNTGGMGAIAPCPFYTREIAHQCMEEIYIPTARAMVQERVPFSGCLFFGLMLTEEGPKVLEYNARFGDPETQAVLSLMDSDLLTALGAVRDGNLREDMVSFRKGYACCVVAASKGYPGAFDKGYPIRVEGDINAQVHMAGVAAIDGALVTNGGRVLAVTATGDTLNQAIDSAYQAMDKVYFDNKYIRRDIGQSALKGLEG